MQPRPITLATTRQPLARYFVMLAASLLLLLLLAACGEATPTQPPASVPTATAGATTSASTTQAATTSAVTTKAATTAAATTKAATATPAPKTTPAAILRAQAGTPFSLKINQSALIEPDNIQVKFLRVLEDSRCPTNVNCAWSGQTVIEVAVSKNGQEIGKFTLNNIEAFKNKDKKLFEDYALTLVKVEPGRIYENFGSSNSKITDLKPEDYTVSLLATRLTSASGLAPLKAKAGTNFALRMNQTAQLETDNIEITFVRVVEDGRCPVRQDKGIITSCYASKPVVVEVAVSKNGKALGNFKLSSSEAAQNKKTFENYAVALWAVEPQRVSDDSGSNNGQVIEVNPENYLVTLLVTKLA